ncbi:hypothetical protein TNCV_4262261 [Trichonephila clavipes]|nr:hypothetical protein TNCV_4262261 [Trichonephila clavipes]
MGLSPPFPSTNLTRGLAARWLFRVPPAAKARFIYKHPCLLRDSNPGPTALQSASLSTIPDGRLFLIQNVDGGVRVHCFLGEDLLSPCTGGHTQACGGGIML